MCMIENDEELVKNYKNRPAVNSDLNTLLAAMKSYNKRNNKYLYLTLYQDGSGYFGEEVGIHSEIEFEFQNTEDLLKKLGG